MILAELPLSLQLRHGEVNVPCVIEASFGRDEKLRIKTKLAIDLIFPEQNHEVLVRLPGGACVKCIPQALNIFSGSATCDVELHPLRSPLVIDHGEPLRRVNAGIYNFGERGLYTVRNRKLSLHDGQWCFSIIATGEQTASFWPELQDKTFRVTHLVELSRVDGELFFAADAQERLNDLARFLSFCHGHRVGVGYASGVNLWGVKTLDVLGMGSASPYANGDGWLDRHDAKNLPDLFVKFLAKTRIPLWSDMFNVSTYWLSRGETSLSGPDGGIILLQAALERIAWDVLTAAPLAISETKAEKLKAIGRLRLLLEHFRIPTEIPLTLRSLLHLARAEGWRDGPAAFVNVRNELIHPRRRISSPSKIPYYECYTIGRWYVELSLLALLDYQGAYSNRTSADRWVGKTEAVPWMVHTSVKPQIDSTQAE